MVWRGKQGAEVERIEMGMSANLGIVEAEVVV
jgi:hypothetical protein